MRRFLVVVMLVIVPAVPAAAGQIPNGRYAIGDSVMVGAAPQLRNRGIQVNATVSRQFSDALSIVRGLKRQGALKRTVIVHLGTNGVLVQPSVCDELSKAVGRDRRLFLVTIKIDRAYRRTQNDRLRACAVRHANTRLIDWWGYSHDHPSWFYADGYHLRPAGRLHYAGLIHRATN